MQPDVIPSPERAVGIAMMTGEFLRKIRSLEFHFRFSDARDAELLDKDVRRQQHQAAHAVMNCGMNQRDGSAVTVPDQNGIFNPQLAPADRARCARASSSYR